VFGRKKTRSKWDNIVIIAVLCLAVGMSLTGCNGLQGTASETHGDITATAFWQPVSQDGSVNVALTLTAMIPDANGVPTPVSVFCAGVLRRDLEPWRHEQNLTHGLVYNSDHTAILNWKTPHDNDEDRRYRSELVWRWWGLAPGWWNGKGSGHPNAINLAKWILVWEGSDLLNPFTKES
jgi:hypothetical protein